MNEFFETWKLWWSATEPPVTHILWGHPLFVWARWGKVLELVGASVALSEILVDYAKTVARDNAPSEVKKKFTLAYSDVESAWNAGFRAYLTKAAPFSPILLIVFLLMWWFTGASTVLGVLLIFILSLLVLALVSLAVMVSMVLAGWFLARPVAWIGARKPVVISLGVVFVFLGVMLDLLGT